jgi:hypothetical protein
VGIAKHQLLSRSGRRLFAATSNTTGGAWQNIARSLYGENLLGLGIAAQKGSFALTGQPVSFSVNKNTTANNGTFALDGKAISCAVTKSITADKRDFTLTGNSVLIKSEVSITAEKGTFTFSGKNTNLTVPAGIEYNITAEKNSFALSGKNQNLGKALLASSGKFRLFSTQSNTLSYSFKLDKLLDVDTTNAVAGSRLRWDGTQWRAWIEPTNVITASSFAFAITRRNITLQKTSLYQVTAQRRSFVFTGRNIEASRSTASGLLADRRSFAFAGNSVDTRIKLTYNITAQKGTFNVSGRNITSIKFISTQAARNSFVLTRRSSVLTATYRNSLVHGQFNLSGNSVTIISGLGLVCSRGAIALTRRPVSTGRSHNLVAERRVFAFNGRTVNTQRTRTFPITANRALFALTGGSVAPTISIHESILAGSITVNGPPIGLSRSYRISADRYSYSISGSNIAVNQNLSTLAAKGSFILTGNELGRIQNVVINLEKASFVFTGRSVILDRPPSGIVASARQYILTRNAVSLRFNTDRKRSSFYFARNATVRFIVPKNTPTTDPITGNIRLDKETVVVDLFLKKIKTGTVINYPGVDVSSTVFSGYSVYGSSLDPRIKKGIKGMMSFAGEPEKEVTVLDTIFRYGSIGLIGNLLSKTLGDTILLIDGTATSGTDFSES